MQVISTCDSQLQHNDWISVTHNDMMPVKCYKALKAPYHISVYLNSFQKTIDSLCNNSAVKPITNEISRT